MKKRSLSGILFFFICLTGLFSQEKNYSEQLITVKNGGVVQLGDVKVEIPAGALKEDTVISITRLDQVQDTGDTISNATNNLGGYRFLPAGTKFRKNVTISIPYEPSLNAKPLVLNDTYTYFYDVEKKGWIQLERKAIDNQNCIIQSYTNHFTDMINATLTMPETASPVDFNLNSIKGLEASKADAQVLNFNPPQGSNYGDAGFTLTLDILSGRNGMQPQIQIAYSSSIDNGIFGKGFDINFGSAITIDTRKKLPEYNENDIYMLDGTQLRLINKYNDCYEYELKRKTGYQIIRRYNPYSNDSDRKDYWEVISSNGVISRYGLEDNSTVGQDDKIFTWYLTKVIDQNQNFMEYKYFKDSGYVYIDDISYTGHADETGPYHVKFEYEDRQDVRIDARSGQAVSCKKRVKTIQSYYQNLSSLFREYEFKYKEGLSKSSLLETFIVYSSDKQDSYEYSFDYYEVDGKNYFGTPVKFSSETKLDKSSSFSSGASVYGSGGLGVGKNFLDFRTSASVNKSNSSTNSETELLLIDINGDGFVDRLEKDDEKIKVYKGKTNGDGFENNSIPLNIIWNGIPEKTFKFNAQKSTSDSKSGSAYAGLFWGNSKLTGGVGYTFTATDTSSTNTSSSCFMDVDADGFVDIVIDTETYLHNDMGEISPNSSSIQFTACKITDFPSFTKTLDTEEKKKLSKDYLMNRPFKVWKAPYNGTVIVNNSVTSSNPNLKGNIYYKNENNAQEKKVVTSNLQISKYLKTNQDIFFVPDTGDDIPQVKNENRNKSMNWDIDIQYTSVKPFEYEGNYIFLMPDQDVKYRIESDDYEYDNYGNKIRIKNWKFSSSDIPSGLTDLYTFPSLSNTTNITSLKVNWKDSLQSLNKASIEYLISTKKYIPYVITYTQLESLKLDDNKKQLLQLIYYYDYSTNCFYLDDSRISYLNSNIINTIKDECLYNFNIAEIPVKFIVEGTTIKPLYELNKSIELTDNNRFNENTTGTFDEMGSIFNIQTKVGNDFINKIIKEDDTWVLDSEKDLFTLKNVNSTAKKIEIELQDKENKYIIKLCFENNQIDNAVSVLTEQEMNYLYEKYKKNFTFDGIKNEIIDYIYKIEVADDDTLKREDIHIDENYLSVFFNEAIESGYINTNDINIFIEESVDKELTDAFVEKYINYYFYCIQVPAYSKNGDKWNKDSTITNRISNDTIIDELKLYSYKNYSANIFYNTESQYEIVSFGNNQNGFSILKLNEASDFIDIDYEKIVLDDFKLFTKSDQSFSANNNVEEKLEKDSVIKGFKVQKTLYGGYNGWYYAIWTGTESENPFLISKVDEYLCDDESNIPDAFLNFTEDDEIKAEGEAQLSKKFKEDEKNFNDNKDKIQCEILSITNQLSVFDENNLLKANTLKEQETGMQLSNDDNESILVGNINQKSVRNEDDNRIYFQYYFAYIKGNTINCSRTNGDSYYYVFGMPDNSSIKILTKTETTGNEWNHSISGNIGSLSASASKSNSNSKSKMKQSFMDITGDRIPDVLISNGNKIIVYKGIINNKELTFIKLKDDEFKIDNVSSISFYENENEGGSGSLSLGPTFVTQVSSSGKLRGVISNGFGLFNGEDKQYIGFLDINGDGIEDYVTTDGVRLGSIQGLLDSSDFTIKDENNKIDSISKSEVTGDNISFPFMGSLDQLDFLDSEQLSEIIKLCQQFDMLEDEKEKEALQNKINEKINGATTNNISLDFTLSLNGSFSSTDTVRFMTDINGDGLLDLVEDEGGSINVRYNLGDRFDDKVKKIVLPLWTEAQELRNNNSSNTQTSSTNTTNQESSNETKTYNEKLQSNYTASGIISFNMNVNGTFKHPIFWGLMGKILGTGGTNINFNWGDSHSETKFMDIDGDGLPDAVIATDKGIFYKKNLSGQADLIKSIKIPQGGVCKIEYGYVAPSYNMPMAKNVMSKVTLTDGSLDEKGQRLDEKGQINENLMPYVDNGDHETVVTYKYENGKYDRAEREYYGFGTLTTTSENGNYTVSTFKVNPDEYWLKGFNESTKQYTNNRFLLSEKFVYPASVSGVEEVALPGAEETKYYEKSNDNTYLSSKTEYKYDNYLNVTELTTKYNDDDTKKIKVEVTYLNDYENNHYSLPTEITVYGTNAQGQEELLRKRKGDYSPTGNLISLEQYYEENKALKTILDYDNKGYGNIVKVTDPTRVSVEYEYDDLNQFVKTIKQVSSIDNSDVLVTKVEIDPKYQVKQKETDLNGNIMTYKYDNWQRLTEVYSPYDEVGNPDEACVKFEYYTPVNSFWYVITTNKVAFEDVPAGQPNYIKTIVIQDGLSCVVQTAKTGYICENPEADENSLSFKKGWNVSGSVKYDGYGRVTEQGQTYFVEGESVDTIIKEKYTNNEYVIKEINVTKNLQFDERDRVTKTELPDGKLIQNEYSIERKYLKTVAIDPKQNRTVQFTDSQGKILRVEKQKANKELLTFVTYEYNMMGEMLKAVERGKEDLNNPAPENPVTVEYDMLGRTLSLDYVDSGKKQYYYDDSTLLQREDDSRLRNENRNISYEYDGFNRLVKIDYLNKEDTIITYGTQDNKNINAYGRVVSVHDEGTSVTYKYGKLGQVVEEKRTITNFIDSHSVKEQKSATMKYQSDYLGRMQKIIYPDGEVVVYSYDYGGQVNKVSGKKPGLPDIDYVKNIGYDEQGQRNFIIFGNGVKTTYQYNKQRGWLKNIYTVSYNNNNQLLQNINYDFDAVGNVKGYVNNCITGGNYSTDQTYEYDDLYQLTSVTGNTKFYETAGLSLPTSSSTYTQVFKYDQRIPGNLIKKTSTEDSRNTPDSLNYDLDYTYDPNFVHRVERAGDKNFVYDASGNLILEYDGEKKENPEEDDYIIINTENNVYGTEGAWGYGSNRNGGDIPNYTNKRKYEWDDRNQLIRTVDNLYDTNYVYNNAGQRVAKYTSNSNALSETLYFNNFWTWHYDTANAYTSYGQYSKNIYLGETRIVTRLLTEETNSVLEPERTYYYHTDHLGSASLVTNSNGEIYERLEYTPYGEVWVDICEETGLLYLPYKFSAKERDSETGLYYYGARYLDPKYSLWKSTDPALGEYIPAASTNDDWSKKNSNLPGMGGVFNPVNLHLYHYAGNNPIRYIDPDGRRTVSRNSYRAKNGVKDFEEVGIKAYENKTIEQQSKQAIDSFFNASSIGGDVTFSLSQILVLAGITEGSLVTGTGAIGVFFGYVALANRLNFHPELDAYNKFNDFYWEMKGQINKEGIIVFDFTMTFEEDLYVKQIPYKNGQLDIFVDEVTVTCSYYYIDPKNGNFSPQKKESPKITICKKEYNASDGNKLWRKTFGTSYYNRFVTWLYDNIDCK